MTRARVLVGVVVVIAIAVVIYLWGRGGARSPSTANSGPQATPRLDAAAGALRAADAAIESGEVVAVDGRPKIADLKLGLDDAHAHLRDAIAPCFAKLRLPATAHLQVRYHLLVVAGKAEPSEAAVIDADVPLGAAQACLLEAIDAAEWSTELPDLDTPIEDEFAPSEL